MNLDSEILQKLNTYIKEINYKCFSRGCIVFAPPATGKTFFINNQDENNKVWLDADIVLGHFKIHTLEYHDVPHSEEEDRTHYLLCDKWLKHMKYLGMNILGSLFYEYIPDAVVIIDKNVHNKYIDKRTDLEYNYVLKIIHILEIMVFKYNIILFDNLENLNSFV